MRPIRAWARPSPSCTAIGIALLVASRWETAPFASVHVVTLGRISLLLIGAAFVLEICLSGDMARFMPDRIGLAFATGMLGEALLIVVSVATRGQNSSGALNGYLELTFVGIAALLAARSHPEARLMLLTCAAGGALLGCAAALVFGHPIAAIRDAGERLSGHYGNPNFLGFAASLAVPLFVALGRRSRGYGVACVVGTLVTVAVVLMTYSRGALLGTVAGTVAVIALVPSQARRRLQVGVGLTVAIGLFAYVTYPLYENLRTAADFGSSTASFPDRSGWSPAEQGLLPAGPSTLSNPRPRTLRVSATRSGEGASVRLGVLEPHGRYILTFSASAPRRATELSYGLEDNLTGGGPTVQTTLLSPMPTRLSMTWVPNSRSPHARAYFWSSFGGAIDLSRLTLRAPTDSRRLPTRLRGRVNTAVQSETRFVSSRQSAAQLALDLLLQHPLAGVGWQRFPSFAARRLHFGLLATHDDYVRYAAELGLPGVVFLLLSIAAVAAAALSSPRSLDRTAALGCITAGAVGLLFVNALEVPSICLPFVLSAGLLCASRPMRTSGDSPSA